MAALKTIARNAVPGSVQNAAARMAADLRIQARIDGFFQRAAGRYTVNGVEVSVMPFFRMTNGPAGPAEKKKAEVFAVTGGGSQAFNRAVHRCAYGRCTPEELRVVTQALIGKGKLDEVRKKYDAMPDSEFLEHGLVRRPLDDVNAIKLLQWDYGLGIDCAGYVQLAFLDVHGGTRKMYGFESIGNEDLSDLKGNKAFDRATTPVDARPGDLIFLRPPPGDTVGHTVLVRDRQLVTTEDARRLSGFDAFSQPTDTVHRIEVHGSWGARQGDLNVGGVQSRSFLYNERTGKWADVHGDQVFPQAVGPYQGHPVEGIYHPKRAG